METLPSIGMLYLCAKYITLSPTLPWTGCLTPLASMYVIFTLKSMQGQYVIKGGSGRAHNRFGKMRDSRFLNGGYGIKA